MIMRFKNKFSDCFVVVVVDVAVTSIAPVECLRFFVIVDVEPIL